MDILQGVSYYFSRDGQQFGPAEGAQLVQMAQTGQVLATDHIWTEGMPEWVPATSFAQLASILSPRPAAPTIVAPSTNTTPEIARTQIMHATPMRDTVPPHQRQTTGPVVETAVDQGGTLHVARKGVAGPGIRKANIQTRSVPLMDHARGPGANFGLLLGALVVFLIGLMGWIVILQIRMADEVLRAGQSIGEGELSPGMEFLVDYPFLVPLSAGLMIVGGLVYGVLSLVYLHRGWSYLQDLPNVSTTPGKAVGFLFIPLFNIAWQFFAYYNWSRDYNQRWAMGGSREAARATEGLFLAHCILTILGFALLHPIVMFQMCRGINLLSRSPALEYA